MWVGTAFFLICLKATISTFRRFYPFFFFTSRLRPLWLEFPGAKSDILFLGFNEVRDSPLRSSPIQSPKVPRGHYRDWEWAGRGGEMEGLYFFTFSSPFFISPLKLSPALSFPWCQELHWLRCLIIFSLHSSGILFPGLLRVPIWALLSGG